MSDDFEALFDEVAAQRVEVVPAAEVHAGPDKEVVANAAGTASEKQMFERLGGIVRQLHDSMRELGYDRALSEASSQITDAQGRLEHIAQLTEQAANKVLNTIDEGMPAQDALTRHAKDIEGRWEALFAGKMSVEEFKTLAADSRTFAGAVDKATEVEKSRLLSIMMAQDFQDITGQLIKKIIVITQQVESDLAQLLRDNAPPDTLKEKPVELMQGPSTSAMVQNDVDSLLADLGF